MKIKSVAAAIIGGTIVIYFVKPLLDWFVIYMTNTSLSLFSGWQNRVYSKVPLFDSADISIAILLLLILILVLTIITFSFFAYKKTKSINEKLNNISDSKSIESNIKSSKAANINIKKIKRENFITQMVLIVYVLFVISFSSLFFAERSILVNEKRKFSCKIALIEATTKNEKIKVIKLKWLKTKTKLDNINFHKYVDSILINNGISIEEYCD